MGLICDHRLLRLCSAVDPEKPLFLSLSRQCYRMIIISTPQPVTATFSHDVSQEAEPDTPLFIIYMLP